MVSTCIWCSLLVGCNLADGNQQCNSNSYWNNAQNKNEFRNVFFFIETIRSSVWWRIAATDIIFFSTQLCRYNEIFSRYNDIFSRYNDIFSRNNEIFSRYNDIFFS